MDFQNPQTGRPADSGPMCWLAALHLNTEEADLARHTQGHCAGAGAGAGAAAGDALVYEQRACVLRCRSAPHILRLLLAPAWKVDAKKEKEEAQHACPAAC